MSSKAAFAACFSILLLASAAWAETKWQKQLAAGMNELDAEYPGQLGVFVHDLRTGESFNFRGEERWYFASGVKIVVAVEVLRQVEEGKLTLDAQMKLEAEDYIDGAGELNWAPPGTFHTIRYLLEQMMINSDNTATDMLIKKVGIENVNALAKKHKMGRITLLADVRRKMYGAIHPAALKLKNKELMELSRAPNDQERAAMLERMIQVPPSEWKKPTIEAGFFSYYAEGWNTGSLKRYTIFLTKLSAGTLLNPDSAKTLVDIMERAKTGEARLKATWGEQFVFAHKTGTQRKRICDFGIIRRDGTSLVVISACARGFATTPDGEKALSRVGGLLLESGILNALNTKKVSTGEGINE